MRQITIRKCVKFDLAPLTTHYITHVKRPRHKAQVILHRSNPPVAYPHPPEMLAMLVKSVEKPLLYLGVIFCWVSGGQFIFHFLHASPFRCPRWDLNPRLYLTQLYKTRFLGLPGTKCIRKVSLVRSPLRMCLGEYSSDSVWFGALSSELRGLGDGGRIRTEHNGLERPVSFPD